MAGARKLQADIDRTLKRINEGIEEFDNIYENIQSAEGQINKMKLEEDLKKEIKKLQRYRDQLKTWITTPDIKNKQPLTDCRSLIERRMEIFKIVERETKTKAYSKEGLMRDQTISPEEKKRLKVREWVQELVSKLYDEVDTLDTELETLQETAGSKMSKKDKETITSMENIIKNHKTHIDNLEILTQLLDNNKVDPDEIDNIKEDLDYYMEQAREPDYEADFGLYDNFDLTGATLDDDDDDDDNDNNEDTTSTNDTNTTKAVAAPVSSASVATVSTPTPTSTPVASKTPIANTTTVSSTTKTSTVPTSTVSTTLPNKPTTSTIPPKTGTAPPPPGLSTSSSSRSNESSTSPIASVTTPAPSTTTAATFSSKVAGTTNVNKVTTPGPNVPTPVTPAPITSKTGESMANILRNKTIGATGTTTVGTAPSSTATTIPTTTATNTSTAPSSTASTTPTLAPSVASIIARAQQQAQAASTSSTTVSSSSSSTSPSSANTVTPTISGTPTATVSAVAPPKGDGLSNPLIAATTAASVIIPEPILSNPWLPLSSQQLRYNAYVLTASINHLPEAIDTERPKTYIPKQPYPTHTSFPQQPIASLDVPSIFEHFNIDTLFFIFYYNQNSYHQYLAARELRKHAWRFHKKYTTWFLRGEEPRTQTDQGETGTYFYFDYESGWCQRMKKGFTFEYNSLEDELV